VGRELRIYYNDALTDLTGVEQVEFVGGDLRLSWNEVLVDATALHGLTEDPALTTAAARELVEAIDVIGGTVTVEGND
jgi:hypothetical protein